MNTTIYAVRFASHTGKRREYFHGRSGEPWGDPVTLDYFVWLIRSPHGDVVVDAGFTREVGERRKRAHYVDSPSALLGRLGVDCAAVSTVIVSHFHYDHVGELDAFPTARFVVQDRELAFWTGRYASRAELLKHVEADDIMHITRASLDGRVLFVDGDREVLPGISVHLVGGHTPGTQVVRVVTDEGPILLATDASHLDEHVHEDKPGAVFTSLPDVYGAFDRMRDLVDGDLRRIIPGHSPALMERLVPHPGMEGTVGVVSLTSGL